MALGTAIKNIAIRSSRFLVQHTPEILMIVGTAGVISGTVVIAKASTKLEDELKDVKDAQDDLKEKKEEMDDKEYKKELLQIKKAAALKVAKLYTPGTLLVVGGVVCYFAAFGKVKKENGILAASLAAVNKAFDEYRARVIEEYGDDKDKEFLYGLKKKKIVVEETDENGNTKQVEKEVLVKDDAKSNISQYAIRFTPEFSTEASEDINYNVRILRAIQRDFNALLPGRKKIFLNEVYRALDIEETEESRRVGWDYNEDTFGDGKIEFIVTCITVSDVNDPRKYHNELIVDFNVDGDLMHKLPKNPSLLGMETQDHIDNAFRIVEF